MRNLEFKDGLDAITIEDFRAYVRIELLCGGMTVVERLGSNYAWRLALWLIRWNVYHWLRYTPKIYWTRLKRKIFSPSNS